MTQLSLPERYTEIWGKFTRDVSQFSKELINDEHPEFATLHELLKSLQPIPYNSAPELFDGLTEGQPEIVRSNTGSATGLFFELVAASVVKGYISKRFPDARIELNKCSVDKFKAVARDPDIFVHYKGRHLVFELKTSPKKGDLEYTQQCYKDYKALGDTKYFLIGGHVSTNSSYLENLLQGDWACFMSGSSRNENVLSRFPLLDDLLADAATFLSAA